jgi:transposase-like protein
VDKPPKTRAQSALKTGKGMIIFVDVSLKQIFKLKEKFPWPKPKKCPKCSAFRVWKHGFALANFDGFSSSLVIRRFRCPDCGGVIRMRPAGYFSRFQASITTIRSSIVSKLYGGRWVANISRTRQLHWYNALKRRVKAWFGDILQSNLLAAFDFFVLKGIAPVSRSL